MGQARHLARWEGTAKIDKAKYRDGFAVITAALTSLDGQPPYFSVQGETWTTEAAWKAQRESAMHSAGMQHDLALELFPFLAPVVALHLADVNGVPMHAEANGWYWYSDNDGKGVHELYSSPFGKLSAHERAADYLRVRGELLPINLDRESFKTYVRSLYPQWRVEADRARNIIINGPNIAVEKSVAEAASIESL